MPVIVPENLPANEILKKQNIFILDKKRARHQDIRPLQFGVLNLMPLKIETETNLLLLLSNSPIQIVVTFIHPTSHIPKNTSENHLRSFYKTFQEIKNEKFDGFIVTGAPVEQLPFTEVDYWNELIEILDYVKNNVTSTLFLCWGAQAALYHYYKIDKHILKTKQFGVFKHTIIDKTHPLFRGFDDYVYVPHSRHTDVKIKDIIQHNLKILMTSKEVGVNIVSTSNSRLIFSFGHMEYSPMQLHNEYIRDLNKGIPINKPKNYYCAKEKPIVTWSAHANLWYQNWINYIYQVTPYDLKKMPNG